jgi:hypothetical protein
MEGPITNNGIHPITGKGYKMVEKGVAGSAKASTPQASQVAAAGATETGASGKHMQNGTNPPPLPQKTMAEMMYPEKLGLRGEKA